jgi:hypothetical protein
MFSLFIKYFVDEPCRTRVDGCNQDLTESRRASEAAAPYIHTTRLRRFVLAKKIKATLFIPGVKKKDVNITERIKANLLFKS